MRDRLPSAGRRERVHRLQLGVRRIELPERTDSEQLAVKARTEERHVVLTQALAVERVDVFRRAVLVRELQMPIQQSTHIRRTGSSGAMTKRGTRPLSTVLGTRSVRRLAR